MLNDLPYFTGLILCTAQDVSPYWNAPCCSALFFFCCCWWCCFFCYLGVIWVLKAFLLPAIITFSFLYFFNSKTRQHIRWKTPYVCESFPLKPHIASKGMRFSVWEEAWKGAVLEATTRLVAFRPSVQRCSSSNNKAFVRFTAERRCVQLFFLASFLLVPLQTLAGRVEDGKVAGDLRGATRRSLRGRIRERV